MIISTFWFFLEIKCFLFRIWGSFLNREQWCRAVKCKRQKISGLWTRYVVVHAVSLLRFCAWKCWRPSFKHQTNNFKLFFVHFYDFRNGLVKSLISNIYSQNIRLWWKCNHLMQRAILSLTQNKSEKMPIK
jgi:hypothetical protein